MVTNLLFLLAGIILTVVFFHLKNLYQIHVKKNEELILKARKEELQNILVKQGIVTAKLSTEEKDKVIKEHTEAIKQAKPSIGKATIG